MPTRHQNDVTKDRALLLYAIVTGERVDVGLTINGSIAKYLRGSTTGALPHASLITGLCRQAGVQWRQDELLQPPMAVIDHATIQRYKVWEGAESHPRGRGFCRPRPPTPEPHEEAASPSSSIASPSIYPALTKRLDRLERRMERRFDALADQLSVMHQFNAQFSSALAHVFSDRSGSSTTPVQFPPYPEVPPYPPSDSSDAADKEVAGSKSPSQGSPVF